jgi:hypothetical protein
VVPQGGAHVSNAVILFAAFLQQLRHELTNESFSNNNEQYKEINSI